MDAFPEDGHRSDELFESTFPALTLDPGLYRWSAGIRCDLGGRPDPSFQVMSEVLHRANPAMNSTIVVSSPTSQVYFTVRPETLEDFIPTNGCRQPHQRFRETQEFHPKQ
jgi:hypothetical protein